MTTIEKLPKIMLGSILFLHHYFTSKKKKEKAGEGEGNRNICCRNIHIF
uniref:Uncharacterized protein n=1 Tax=Rhizophora mucronata TaxID=61149 RepID=A0A2P2PTF0_RHIMU